jgi:TolB-like protein
MAVETRSARTGCRAGDSRAGVRSAQKGVFRKEGRYWTVGYAGNSVHLKETRGLKYIAHLLRHPDAEFHVLDLAGGIASQKDETTQSSVHGLSWADDDLENAGIHITGLGDAGEMLDEPAKAAYRRRLSELREELQAAKAFGKVELADQAEKEIDALMMELSRAVGLGGRDRLAASASERARQSVTKSIKSALETISQSEAALGDLLSRCIKTGTYCSYQPDPNFPIAWEFAKTTTERGERSIADSGIAGPPRVYGASAPIYANRATRGGSLLSKPSLVVLPFINMSDDPEQEYFSDGITEDIIVDLSQVSALFVVAWNTAFTLKSKGVEIPELVRKLNVRYLLEGSVRRAGNRVRITAQLIDGATGGHLWAERYDREFGDVFALQDDITRSVVAALKVRLLPAESKLIADRSTSSSEAYEYYLKGRSRFFESWGSSSTMRAARDLFVKAVEIDPAYAKAYIGIADCDAFLWINGDLEISHEDLLAVSSKALELEPDMAEAHASRGIALWVFGHAQEAGAAFERAIGLDPLLFQAHFFYGINCRDRGDFDRAATLLERAAELRSDDFASLTLLANVYELQGRAELCRDTARRSLIRIESTLSQRPNAAEVLGVGAATLVYLGENARAIEWAKRAISVEPGNFTVRYNAACTYAVIGAADTALEHLEYILSHVPRARRWLLKIIKNDPQFASMRSRSDFQSFMDRLEAHAR